MKKACIRRAHLDTDYWIVDGPELFQPVEVGSFSRAVEISAMILNQSLPPADRSGHFLADKEEGIYSGGASG